MKKLGKLSINPERVMKNEELVNLRGGYTGDYTGEECSVCGGYSKVTWCMANGQMQYFCDSQVPGRGCSNTCRANGYTEPFGCWEYSCF